MFFRAGVKYYALKPEIIQFDSKATTRRRWRIIKLVCLCFVVSLLLFIAFAERTEPLVAFTVPVETSRILDSMQDEYLVWSPNCHIPSMSPFAEDAMHIFHSENYEMCSEKDPLTSIEINWNTSTATVILKDINNAWYSKFVEEKCCYSEILRAGAGENADNHFELGPCIPFEGTFNLPAHVEFILARCSILGISTYKNTHAIIRERPNIRHRLDEAKAKHTSRVSHPVSVLMLAIDSVSRLNLLRAMPITAQYLHEAGWFELQGYNKIGDNTFPNIMAIMTGYNESFAFSECQPAAVGKMDKCPFVWKDFRDNGYVTAYGEDEMVMSSFNYLKNGFESPPTDYYMRPYMLAAESHLKIKEKHFLSLCLGYKHSAEHIYDYAVDFATQFRQDPSFGLFWTNTFSHSDVSDPSKMDRKMLSYFETLETRHIFNKSVVILLSDHGMRFGPMRQASTGWLEERMPFIFIWLPPWFRIQHPEIVQALKINRNRLTNPYDLHMTLKHILLINSPEQTPMPTMGCPNCQSLFYEIPWDRSCEDASIDEHWCTCATYHTQNKSDPKVQTSTEFVIDQMNNDLEVYGEHHNGDRCAKLTLKLIANYRLAEYLDVDNPRKVYIVLFQVSPSDGWFEATVKYFLNSKEFTLTESVSRLDTYSGQSECMRDNILKKYCFCI